MVSLCLTGILAMKCCALSCMGTPYNPPAIPVKSYLHPDHLLVYKPDLEVPVEIQASPFPDTQQRPACELCSNGVRPKGMI